MHSLEKLKENSVWYDANLDSLLPQYRGRYIAISEGAITERAAWCGARRPAEPLFVESGGRCRSGTSPESHAPHTIQTEGFSRFTFAKPFPAMLRTSLRPLCLLDFEEI